MDQIPLTPPMPTITITCPLRSVPDNGGWTFATPQVTITHMPAGWKGAHYALTLALQAVLAKVEEEARNERLVQPVSVLPGGNGLLL